MAESSDVALHDLAKGYLARDAIITSYEALSPDASMKAAEAALLRTTQTEFPVLDPDNRWSASLRKPPSCRTLRQAIPSNWWRRPWSKAVPTLKLTDPLEDVLDLLQDADTPIVAVSDKTAVSSAISHGRISVSGWC
jgi:hypothetical protein